VENTLSPEQVVEKLDSLFAEKTANLTSKEQLDSAITEIKADIESLNSLEGKTNEIQQAIAKFEGRLEGLAETKLPAEKKLSHAEMVLKTYADNLPTIKDTIERGGKMTMEVKDTTITNDYTGKFALTDFDPEIDRVQYKRYGILENANTGTTTGKFIVYVQQTNGLKTAWTPESEAKQEGEPAWEEISTEVKKVASFVKVSKEMLEDLSFVRGEINNALLLELRETIESALITGVPGSILGLLDAAMGLPAFGAGPFAASIPNANITDLLRVVMAQIEAANFTATHVIMNPQDIATLQLTKGTDGTYTYPMYLPTQDGMGEMRVAGMRVISSTYIDQDKYIVGDLSKLNVRFRENINLTVGLDADDFTRNMVTMLGEARLVSYVKNNQKPAFVVGTISTDIALIDKP
tara:strand:+ start:1444 stop:2667 length:1224 start_codon:yes stop_codon:yes gene_type:complete